MTPTAAPASAQRPAAAKASPAPAVAAGDVRRDDLRSQVLAGFRGEIAPVRTTPMYQLGIALTALFMILLPLIYIGFIGLVGAAVWWHLTHDYGMLAAGRGGRAAALMLIIYLAPLVIGAILIAFMFKPLLARPAQEGRRRSLTPHSDPLLFEFVERICDLVGAPRPRRIDIDCQINASAGFRRGWWSLLTGRDLVLTIGLPLAAGLSLRQFAGVLAHEFGHFSQGAGMRLSYVIRSINFWFVRVVYERDAWDAWLEAAPQELDIRLGWVLYVAQGCVWLTRRLLWLLMYLGHIVAGFMLRQMEFDADKYEARLAGSDAFASTVRQLRLLGFAWNGAQHDLASYHREGRLADNLPQLMLANLRQLPAEVQALIDKQIAEATTGLFDSHPADQDRVRAAQAEAAAGVFHSDLPASVLFASFDAAAKGVTWDYYCAALGSLVDPKSLHPTEALLARSDSRQAADQARERFFAGALSFLRPLRLPLLHGPTTQHPSIWREALAAARREMEALAPPYREQLAVFDQADTRLVQARQARAVMSTGVRLQARNFEHPFSSASDAAQQREAAQTKLARLGAKFEAFETAAGRRLHAALMLLHAPEVSERIADAPAKQAECGALLPLASQIASLHGSIFELRNTNATFAALLGHVEGYERHEPLIREVLEYAGRVRGQVSDLRGSFERVDYPFDHAGGTMSVAQYLLKIMPPPDEIGAIYEAADQVLKNLMDLYGRVVSRLCALAGEVETAEGLAPLAVPEAAPAVA